MLTDKDYDDDTHPCHTRLNGMKREIEIGSKSGVEYIAQIAEHVKKSYYNVKAFLTEEEAADFYRELLFNNKGRKRLIKVDNSEVSVLKEEIGKGVSQNNLTPFKKSNKIITRATA
jgi:hypothetical protein